MSSSPRSAGICLLLIVLASCQPKTDQTKPAIPSIAILPFENQTGQASADWLPAALHHVLIGRLGQLPHAAVTGAADHHAALQAGAAAVWHGTLVPARDAQHVRLLLTRENTATKNLSSEPAFDLPLDNRLFPALDAIAEKIAGVKAPRFSGSNVDALKEYVAGRTALARDPQEALAHLQRATELDPTFSSAWLARADAASALGQKEEAARLLDEFRTRVPDSPELDQAQAAILAARLKGDSVASAAALKRLAAASPWNKAIQLTAADTFARLRWSADAAETLVRLTKIEPAEGDHWNKLAYARSNLNDVAGARAALEQYRAIAPNDANVLDSQAEIEYRAGNFTRAAEIFQDLHAKAPAFAQGAALGKAAYAKLMAGDLPAADALFNRLLTQRKPVEDLLRAGWLFQTGRRAGAYAKLDPNNAAHRTEECLMRVAAGEWDKALAAAQAALTKGQPTGRALLCAFIAQPAAPVDEWTRRAAQLPEPLRNTGLGYALAFRGHCPAAMAPLRAVLEGADPAADGEPLTMLAYCATENKQWDVVKDLYQQWPVPPTVEPLFTPLVFPLQIAVRGRVEEHFERKDGIALTMKLFKAYAR